MHPMLRVINRYGLAGLIAVLLAIVPTLGRGQTTVTADQALNKAINDLLAKVYKANEPGAAVIVVRNGKPIFRKGYGSANLELGVTIKPEMVFRLGSLTKQFTAVAILMIEEEGKLALADPITKFLPDYPTHEQTITIEHLLSHTSGIKNYTDLPEWPSLWRKDMTLEELIDLFKDKPFDFAPGERWSYSNSGYILLGAIIEKVSGLDYESFIQTRIFTPLGMKHSFYDHPDRLISGRVAGYTQRASGAENAPYLSMTQPYAAGSLASTVDDLALWDTALYTDTLLPPETLQRAFTPYTLNNGEPAGYGYGWSIGEYEGHPLIEHGGGINGFATYAIRLPQDKVYIAILTNSDSGAVPPGDLAFQIAALVIGKPYVEPTPITLPADVLDDYVGVYTLAEGVDVVISRDGDQFYAQYGGGSQQEILPSAEDEFFIPGSFLHLRFERDEAGTVTAFSVRQRTELPRTARKSDKPLPEARQAIEIDPALYQDYVGEYQLAPNFSITISAEADKLLAQATGQEQFEIFPEAEDKFFLTVVDAQLEFVRNDAGEVTGLILYQNGQEMPGEKVK